MFSVFCFMATYDDEWFEIWFSEGLEVIPRYLLIVACDTKNSGDFLIIDPFKNNEVIFRDKDYEKICSWLWEDEYSLVEGRIFPDDGW